MELVVVGPGSAFCVSCMKCQPCTISRGYDYFVWHCNVCNSPCDEEFVDFEDDQDAEY